MKKRELQELKTKSTVELEKALSDLRKKKLEVEVKIASGKEPNLKAGSIIRRDIAQIMTLRGIIERSEKSDAKVENK